jgi:hypothetical protein
MARNYQVWSLAYMGRFAEMERIAKERYRQGLKHGDFFAATCMAAGGYANMAWLVSDEPKLAAQEADSAIALWTQESFHIQHFWHCFARAQIDLYEGHPAEAYQRLMECWPKLRSVFAFRVQHVRQEAIQLRARALVAIAAKRDGDERARLHARVRADVKRLLRERASYSQPYADALEATMAFQRGDRAKAKELLLAAVAGFEKADMFGHAEAARRRAGEVDTTKHGAALVSRADNAMRASGVVNPEKLANVLMPGFDG